MEKEIVLTIDFDIIMQPSIETYNSILGDGDWEELRIAIPFCDWLPNSNSIYAKLTGFLLNISNFLNQNQIFFITSHEQIINYIDKNKEQYLVNIDHHHDIGYDHDDLGLNSGNWVKYIPNLKSYMWINNKNSREIFEKEQKLIPKLQIADIMNYNIMNLQNPDKLIICLSPQWIPPHVRSLFFIWMDMFNRIYKTHFEIEK